MSVCGGAILTKRTVNEYHIITKLGMYVEYHIEQSVELYYIDWPEKWVGVCIDSNTRTIIVFESYS